MRMDGRMAVVTGGGSGIGAATARLFACEGARVCVVDRDGTPAQAGAAEIGAAGGTAMARAADVGEPDTAEVDAAAVLAEWGGIDALVCAAGFSTGGTVLTTAFVITAAEGAALHLERLRTRPADFDPATRDRLIAGTVIPAAWVERAQHFRRWYRARVLDLFGTVDIVLAPCTPCRAPALRQTTMVMEGATVPLRPNIGVFTQPISFIGLPVCAVPVWLDGGLPMGVQVIAAPWREDLALRVARALEVAGAVGNRAAAAQEAR